MSINRDTLLARGKSRRYREVELPGGETIWIRSLRAGELSKYENAAWSVKQNKPTFSLERMHRQEAYLICLVSVDGDGGELLFDPATDTELVFTTLDGADQAAITRAAIEHCGIREVQPVEEAVKNCGEIPNGEPQLSLPDEADLSAA